MSTKRAREEDDESSEALPVAKVARLLELETGIELPVEMWGEISAYFSVHFRLHVLLRVSKLFKSAVLPLKNYDTADFSTTKWLAMLHADTSRVSDRKAYLYGRLNTYFGFDTLVRISNFPIFYAGSGGWSSYQLTWLAESQSRLRSMACCDTNGYFNHTERVDGATVFQRLQVLSLDTPISCFTDDLVNVGSNPLANLLELSVPYVGPFSVDWIRTRAPNLRKLRLTDSIVYYGLPAELGFVFGIPQLKELEFQTDDDSLMDNVAFLSHVEQAKHLKVRIETTTRTIRWPLEEGGIYR